ncbi:DoxX family protein [Fluviicola sp.]|jgi:hypothetical protein|uniref:DoxX family protein n=1 Tax=Fluviicola sp. TaxID=1917219 RepID=UPI00282258E1|nr:DoxX family protein [Fluviicola sp.]MDR0802215.1 DoxX family protein [Fluviicola sp.]
MKKNAITFWTTTSLFSVMMLFSASMYFTSPEVQANFIKMGFQDAFRIELGLAKILGALVLMIPFFNRSIKEWAYAGFGITLISASILHASNGDPVSNVITPLVFFGILAVSHIFWKKRIAPPVA